MKFAFGNITRNVGWFNGTFGGQALGAVATSILGLQITNKEHIAEQIIEYASIATS